jgi:lipopolysaccharide biosynthesis glycosyltransferase
MDEELERHQTYGHVTKPTLLRLIPVDKLAPSYDRIVILDNDVLVFSDLELELLVLGPRPVAAVIDMDLSDTGAIFRANVDPDFAARSPSYFNMGFMVYESRNWRPREFGDKYARALQDHDVECPYKINCTSPDQCAANVVFADNWLPLPISYNMQASAKYTGHWRDAVVRHYCGSRKFIPPSLFRNDDKDITILNDIRSQLRLSLLGRPLYYRAFYIMNTLRKYPRNGALRSFLQCATSRG